MAGFLSKLFGPKKPTPATKPSGFMDKLFAWAKRKKAGEQPPPPPIEQPREPAIIQPLPKGWSERLKDWGKPPPVKPPPPEPPPLPPGDEELTPGVEFQTPEEFIISGDWLRAASSNVHRWRYLYDDQTLEVEFKSGGYYQYYGVPPNVAEAFVKTDSPGRFVWNFLRDKYPYARMRGLETYHGTKVTGKTTNVFGETIDKRVGKPRKPTVIRLKNKNWK